jgi:hypothetical protein
MLINWSSLVTTNRAILTSSFPQIAFIEIRPLRIYVNLFVFPPIAATGVPEEMAKFLLREYRHETAIFEIVFD